MSGAGEVGTRYRVGALIRQGGMADVFEGAVVGGGGFERRVALKRLRPDLADDPTSRRSFEAEARIFSQLHHANVVGVFDLTEIDGLPCQVLELVEGLDLGLVLDRARERGTPLPAELALHIAIEVARALDYVHTARDARGTPLRIVHRDVNPQNILISWAGDIKLTDFGIARFQGRSHRTQVGLVKGKPAYMAPEQLRSDHLDARTDVFALGCVTHTMLCGRSPIETEEDRQRLLVDGVCPIDPSLEGTIGEILRRALHSDRERRYPDARSFGLALGRALQELGLGQERIMLSTWLAGVRPKDDSTGRGRSLLFDTQWLQDQLEGSMEQLTEEPIPDTAISPTHEPTEVELLGLSRVKTVDEERSETLGFEDTVLSSGSAEDEETDRTLGDGEEPETTEERAPMPALASEWSDTALADPDRGAGALPAAQQAQVETALTMRGSTVRSPKARAVTSLLGRHPWVSAVLAACLFVLGMAASLALSSDRSRDQSEPTGRPTVLASPAPQAPKVEPREPPAPSPSAEEGAMPQQEGASSATEEPNGELAPRQKPAAASSRRRPRQGTPQERAAELREGLGLALRNAGLPAGAQAWLDPEAARSFQGCLGRLDLACAQAALDTLKARAGNFVVDRAFLGRRLTLVTTRLQRLAGRLPQEEIGPLDSRLLDLQVLLDRSAPALDPKKVVDRLFRLEQDVGAAESKLQ